MQRKIAVCLALALAVAAMCGAPGLGAVDLAPGDGLYSVAVTSSSNMFKVTQSYLEVRDGQMYATLTLSGQGYGYIYAGTAEAAEVAPEAEWAPYVEGTDGKYSYKIPVSALDQEIPVAAWSKKYEKWYDRTLIFQSASLKPFALIPEDGRYAAQAELDGELTPCTVSVEAGQMRVDFDREGWEALPLASLNQLLQLVPDQAQDAQPHAVYVDAGSLEPLALVLADGKYSLSCASDSGLFRVTACELEVVQGEMVATVTVQRDSYAMIWPGPSEKARLAPESEYIAAQASEDGGCSYRLPLETLAEDVVISTWDAERKAWYERVLHFDLEDIN